MHFPAGILIASLGALLTSSAIAETKIGTWTKENQRKWWTEHPDSASWPAERESIRKQLLDIHERLGTAKAFSNRHFNGWLRHLKWLSIHPGKDVSAETFGLVAMEEDLYPLFLDSLSPHDHHAAAAEILCRLYAAHREDVRKFPALAVAFALVFDQPFPDSWPHTFVDQGDVLREGEPVEKRFAFYVQSAKADRLMLQPDRLSPFELKFVIDTPVPLEELGHLQRIKLRSTRALEDLFPLIPYAQSRLSESDYLWPHGPYRVFTIQKKGGLCVDQAYYTAHAAKAKGIPSIIFLGQGVSGAHAWLGFLQTYGDWAFDLAKFRSERYPVGRTFDPQTWRRLTDSECEFLNRNEVAANARSKARDYLAWAELNPDADFVAELLALARRVAPTYVWAWDAGARHLTELGASAEVRLTFWSDWVRAFARQKDLAFRGQKRILALLEEAGNNSRFEQELEKLMRDNRSKRYDLVIDVAAEQVLVRIENGKWDEAHEAFLKSMVRLRSKAGGELFYRLVEPYVSLCLEAGRTDFAQAALQQAAKSFDANKGSILDRDLRELAALVQAKSD